MATISNDTIQKTNDAIHDKGIAEFFETEEKHSQYQNIVKAALGTNDTALIARVIVTLLPCLTIDDHKMVNRALNSDVVRLMCVKNTLENTEE